MKCQGVVGFRYLFLFPARAETTREPPITQGTGYLLGAFVEFPRRIVLLPRDMRTYSLYA